MNIFSCLTVFQYYQGAISRVIKKICSILFFLAVSSNVFPQTSHPELVTSEITDLVYIEKISKFRSGAGHDFSYDDSFPFGASDATEPDSSMKHYFAPYGEFSQAQGDEFTVPVYAPIDGEIVRVSNEERGEIINKRIEIQSTINPSYTVVLFHINLDEAYPQIYNDWPIHLWPAHLPDDSSYTTRVVTAGDFIGYADMRDSHDFDVAVLWSDAVGDRFWLSYFDLMTDTIFSYYQSRGIARSDFTITKVERQAEPVTWWGVFYTDDWVELTAEATIPIPVWMVFILAVGLVLIRRKR